MPEELTVIERREYGNFYGYPVAITIGGASAPQIRFGGN